MPAKRLVNLLPQDPFAKSFVGRFLYFSITIGRYVVVFTELIVILAFLSRFFLDRQISDLNDRIKEQVGVINASRDFEQNFRLTQARLAEVKSLSANQLGATALVDTATPLISADVSVTRFSVDNGALQLTGSSISIDGLRQTVSGFQNASWLSDVSLRNISSDKTAGGVLRFTLAATLKQKTFKKEGSL